MGIFDECLLQGNFTLSSNRETSVFYDFDLLTAKETAEYAKLLVDKLPKSLLEGLDFIATPAIGGIELAFLVAFALDKPRVKIDKEGKVRGPEFLGQNYLIVDDVISSYQAAYKVQRSLSDNNCIGAASFIFRGVSEDADIPTFYLARKEIEVVAQSSGVA